jgi:putative FmdB family regulatory protein
MPTYEYRCTLCECRFEAFQKMTDLPLSQCPECGGPVQRLIGAGMGLIFKGSGFYITDYKKSNSSTSSAAANNHEQQTGKSAVEQKSSDAKPAAAEKSDAPAASNKTN